MNVGIQIKKKGSPIPLPLGYYGDTNLHAWCVGVVSSRKGLGATQSFFNRKKNYHIIAEPVINTKKKSTLQIK